MLCLNCNGEVRVENYGYCDNCDTHDTKPRLYWYKCLFNAGAHLVLGYRNTKAPDRRRSWRHYKPDVEEIENWRGGLIGLVPASLGMAVIDIDEGDGSDIFNLLEHHNVNFGAVASSRPMGKHIYVRVPIGSDPGHGRFRFSDNLCDLRFYSGYIYLWEPQDVVGIHAALRDIPEEQFATDEFWRDLLPAQADRKLCPSEFLNKQPVVKAIAAALGVPFSTTLDDGWFPDRFPCPVHQGDDDNAVLNRNTGVVYCHSQCQRGYAPEYIAWLLGASFDPPESIAEDGLSLGELITQNDGSEND